MTSSTSTSTMDAEHQTQACRRRHTRGHLALCSCAGGPRPCPAMANSALEERRLFLHADPAAVSGSLQRHVLTLSTPAGRCIICWLRSDEFASMACMLSGEQYTPVPSTFCAAHIRRQNPSNTRSEVPRALFSIIRAPPRCAQRARERIAVQQREKREERRGKISQKNARDPQID